jgi:hypothetical protein
MTTIPIEAQVSPEQLLQAVAQLPPSEFAAFVERLLVLRAERGAPHLTERETALLLEINRGLDAATQERFDALVTKRREERIDAAELADLMRITESIEERDAQRLASLGELADLRQLPLSELLRSLGIQAPPYA